MPGTQILKVIVGSQAHGLATPESDFDYRGVFVLPTSDILALGNKPQQTSWVEGKDDDTSWELGHFLNLAVHCNPTILETFVAPIKDATDEGIGLCKLFANVWSPTRVRDAFCGYAYNQRKKFLDEHAQRPQKFAVAYLRVLEQARYLLLEGYLPVDMTGTSVYQTLKKWKAWTPEDVHHGEVIQTCREYQEMVDEAYEVHMAHKPHEPQLDKVNEWLLQVRKTHW